MDKMVDSDRKDVLYRVHVKTSKFQNAGTKANVFLQLYGRTGQEGKDNGHRIMSVVKIALTNSLNNKKKFQPGQTDLFEVEDADIGELKRLRVSHDGKTASSGWHLKEIVIHKLHQKGVPRDRMERTKWVFTCNKWLDRYQEDKKTECDLEPLSVEEQAAHEIKHQEASEVKVDKKEPEKRRKKSDGFDSDSFSDLDLDYDDHKARQKEKPRRRGSLSPPRRGRDRTRSKSRGSDDEQLPNNKKILDKMEHMNRSTLAIREPVKKITYEMKVKTSECSKPSESMNIELTICGTRKNMETKAVRLNSTPSDNKKEKFRPNSLDLFRFEEADVGQVSC